LVRGQARSGTSCLAALSVPTAPRPHAGTRRDRRLRSEKSKIQNRKSKIENPIAPPTESCRWPESPNSVRQTSLGENLALRGAESQGGCNFHSTKFQFRGCLSRTKAFTYAPFEQAEWHDAGKGLTKRRVFAARNSGESGDAAGQPLQRSAAAFWFFEIQFPTRRRGR